MGRSEPTGKTLTIAEVDAALRSLTGPDWARALSLARMAAAGISSLTPDDLLQETLTKLLEGERVWRVGVHALVTLRVAMHGIASNERKKEKNGPIDRHVTVDEIAMGDENANATPSESAVDEITPEHTADGRNQLKYLENLVNDDEEAGMVLMAWVEGLKGKEAANALGFEPKQYDAARKRLELRLKPLAALRNTA